MRENLDNGEADDVFDKINRRQEMTYSLYTRNRYSLLIPKPVDFLGMIRIW